MRYLERGPEPEVLAAYKGAANEDWKPTYASFGGKAAVSACLAREQAFLCGYCGSPICEQVGDCHIEHVEAQSEKPERALDYTNMLASCQGSDAPRTAPAHCGQARGNALLSVTPFMQDCGAHFSFGSDGRIAPAPGHQGTKAALETIRVLRLDATRLQADRNAAIDGALAELDLLTTSDWLVEAQRWAIPDARGRLAPFCFAIQQVLIRQA